MRILMRPSYLLFFFVFLLPTLVEAQELPCHQPHKTKALLEKHPEIVSDVHRIDAELEELSNAAYFNGDAQNRDEVYIIPVVFHVIHEGGEENISDDQVEDAIRVLNTDFRGLNNDFITIKPEFEDIAADVEIEFRLAQRDPQGNCSRGINRILSPLTNEGNQEMKDLIQWPRDMYLNVWVCKSAGGAAGYTYRPGSVDFAPTLDGIVLLHNYVGAIGTSSAVRGSALTHEVGHWLNLRHTWGPGNTPATEENCFNDDGVPDTPLCEGIQSCNLESASCGSLDNVENYMDYSYCYKMFTEGQKVWMRTALTSSVSDRNELITEENLIATGVFEEDKLCDVNFSVANNIVCIGDVLEFNDESFHGVNQWAWDFGDGNTLSGNDPDSLSNPVHIYQESGVYSVSLTVSNGIEELTEVKDDLVVVLDSAELDMPFFESFESDDVHDYWFVENEDGDHAWEIVNNAAFSGERCMRLRNFNTDVEGTFDRFETSTFDMSGYEAITISYKWAYANRPTETDDRLRVLVSINCGNTWIPKKLHRGSTDLPTATNHFGPFTPNGLNEWSENSITIDATSQLVSNFRLQFQFQHWGGNNVYIDDINIEGLTATDVEELKQQGVNNLNTWPNPTNGYVNVSFGLLDHEELSMEIVDLTGRTVKAVFQRTMAPGDYNEVIGLSDLSSGIYLLNVRSSKGVQSKRIVLR